MAKGRERERLGRREGLARGSRPIGEKKDASGRGERRGGPDHQYTDPDALKANGQRDLHGQPGRKGHGEPPHDLQVNPSDRTRPGGNRPKGDHDHGGVDHK